MNGIIQVIDTCQLVVFELPTCHSPPHHFLTMSNLLKISKHVAVPTASGRIFHSNILLLTYSYTSSVYRKYFPSFGRELPRSVSNFP